MSRPTSFGGALYLNTKAGWGAVTVYLNTMDLNTMENNVFEHYGFEHYGSSVFENYEAF